MRLRRSATAAVALGATALLLTGCGAQAAPGVDWKTTVPQEYAHNRYVAALIEGLSQAAHATNVGDFTFAALNASITPEYRWGIYLDYIRDRSDEAWAFPGPRPFALISVNERADGRGATILSCMALGDRVITAKNPDPMTVWEGAQISPFGEEPNSVVYTQDLAEDDAGHLLLSEPEQLLGESNRKCDLTDAAVGFFDPLPTPRLPGDVPPNEQPVHP
ncbi:MAG: hypothetical protein ABI435_04500 [Pseudolysinimonas sp.]